LPNECCAHPFDQSVIARQAHYLRIWTVSLFINDQDIAWFRFAHYFNRVGRNDALRKSIPC
jgi:hypothetical protein